MAYYSYVVYGERITFSVAGLSSWDSVRFYVREDPDPGYSLVDEVVTATSSSLDKSYFVLSPGTAYAINVKVNDTWLGTKMFTTPGSSGPTRPDDWYWYSYIGSGSTIRLSAREWNDFCDRINEFLEYDGQTAYSFQRVYSGDPISASVVNDAWYAIRRITGHGSLPSTARSGAPIYASFFNGLQDALNATP